jgi:hypothetical protein
VTTCIGDNTLVELVENSLSASEVKRLDQHFAHCADCRRRWVALAASPSRLAQAPTSPAGVGAHLDLAPGTRVGRFVISHEIGRGGMGVVFAARDPHLDRAAAIKLLHSTGGDENAARAQERLLAEARAMARLDHPNIIKVYEAGLYQQETYIAMELVHGETLGQWIKRWQRPWTSVLEVFRQAGSALVHAHAHGLAHGDFKPENVLVDDADRVRVTDFGLSRWFEQGGRPLPANALGDFVGGTPRYMAPEQFRGQPADACSDQFGFCVALFESLYCRHPFARGCSSSLLELPEDQATAPLRATPAIGVPSWLHAVLVRGLDPDPARRYPSMEALLCALDAAQPARVRRARWPVAALAAAALLVVSTAGYALGAWFQPVPRIAAEVPGEPRPDHGVAPRGRRGRGVMPQHPGLSSLALGTAVLLWNAHAQFAPSALVRATMLTLGKDVQLLLDREIQRTEDRLASLRRWHGALAMVSPRAGQVAEQAPAPRVAWRSDRPVRVQTSIEHIEFEQERVNGLGLSEIGDGIRPRWRDIEVCFGEWRERQPHGRHELSARVAIERDGRASVQRVRFHDSVVRKCVAGAIERSRFASAPHDTLVDIDFISEAQRLDLRKSLVE